MEMLMKDTECTGTAILNGRLREHGITAEDDAEMYCLLNSYTTGTAQEFVQLKEGQNAIEVWRQMCHEYDPKTGVSGVQAMGEIIGPTRSKHNADFKKALTRWDSLIKEEKRCGGPGGNLADPVKAAALLAMMPLEMKLEVLKKGKQFSESYKEIRNYVDEMFYSQH